MKKINYARGSGTTKGNIKIDSYLGMSVFTRIALLFISPIRISNPETGNFYTVKKFRNTIYIVDEDESRPYTYGTD